MFCVHLAMEGKLRGGGNYGESQVFDLDGFYFVPRCETREDYHSASGNTLGDLCWGAFKTVWPILSEVEMKMNLAFQTLLY